MKIPQTVREVIEKGPLAHFTTLNSDGSPQVTVVWVGIEGEEFVMAHLAMHHKVKNIRRDPRVALSLLSDKTNAQGMREYVVVHGKARVTDGGAVNLLQRPAPLYLGPGAEYPRLRCGTLRVMSPGSRRRASLGSVRGLGKPLARPQRKAQPSKQFSLSISLVVDNVGIPFREALRP